MPATELVNPAVVAQQWLAAFASALYSGDPQVVAETFEPHGWLRDVLTFTWDTHTLEGREKIIDYLSDNLASQKISDVRLSDDPFLQPKFGAILGTTQGVEFGYTYQTAVALGEGYARLLEEDGRWRGHTVSMIVMDLKGHEEPSGRYVFERISGKKTWGEYMATQKARWAADPHVVISEPVARYPLCVCV